MIYDEIGDIYNKVMIQQLLRKGNMRGKHEDEESMKVSSSEAYHH